jgi:hypothetical protein
MVACRRTVLKILSIASSVREVPTTFRAFLARTYPPEAILSANLRGGTMATPPSQRQAGSRDEARTTRADHRNDGQQSRPSISTLA